MIQTFVRIGTTVAFLTISTAKVVDFNQFVVLIIDVKVRTLLRILIDVEFVVISITRAATYEASIVRFVVFVAYSSRICI